MESPAQNEIHRATGGDASAIAALLHDSFIEFKGLYTDGGFAATVLSPGGILSRMQEGPVWIAVRSTALLGTVSAVVKADSAYIRGMAVRPSARGSGSGGALLRHVEDWAASLGCRRLFLSTTPFLISAIHLYEKSGFRRTDEGPQELAGTSLFTMEKEFSCKSERSALRLPSAR